MDRLKKTSLKRKYTKMFPTYLPHKYATLAGSASNVGLCTCWSDPELLKKKHPTLLDHVTLAGTLYSKEGVSIILRNLALNPTIRYLIVWGNNPLSKTAIGSAGKNLLDALWSKQTNAYKNLHKEIEPALIAKICNEVTLLDWSHYSSQELFDTLQNHSFELQEPYMAPVSFAETTYDTNTPFPSEHVGWSTHGKTLVSAWLQTVDRIMRYGAIKKTEYGMLQKELQSINWTIEAEDPENIVEPTWPQEVIEAVGFSRERRESYKNMLLDPLVPEGTKYTYGNRLRAYQNIDQIQGIIEKLKADSCTRRACATTLYPPVDSVSSSAPCLVLVQILSSPTGTLNCFATFRSHDLGKAALINCYGLLNMLNYIAKQAGYKPGSLTVHSISAHIYESEWDTIQKLLECQLWKSVRTNFDELQDNDPRGYVRIFVTDVITAELTSPEGEVLMSFSGRTAHEIAIKLARLNLLSRPDHYCYVTKELCKAEIALANGERYTQDRPLEIHKHLVLE